MIINEVKQLWKWIGGSALLASMCCAPSILLVAFGLMSVSAADELSNDLYFGPFRYILYGLTIALLTVGLIRYFQKQGICDLEAAKRERKRIVNTSLLVFIISVIVYIVWNYFILEILGISLGLPWEDDAIWK
jgi:accessory gene regulator protein AgrB